jgi:hypothetical protein
MASKARKILLSTSALLVMGVAAAWWLRPRGPSFEDYYSTFQAAARSGDASLLYPLTLASLQDRPEYTASDLRKVVTEGDLARLSRNLDTPLPPDDRSPHTRVVPLSNTNGRVLLFSRTAWGWKVDDAQLIVRILQSRPGFPARYREDLAHVIQALPKKRLYSISQRSELTLELLPRINLEKPDPLPLRGAAGPRIKQP